LEEDTKWKEEWRIRLTELQKKHDELKLKEENLLASQSDKDRAWLVEEFKRFR
jgi:hypothetical protein